MLHCGMTRSQMGLIVRRGDVWLVDFEPARDTEADKTRPAVVVSADSQNAGAIATGVGTVIVIPLTSNVGKVYPFQTALEPGETGLHLDSKTQPELMRAVSVRRCQRKLGTVTFERMLQIDRTIKTILGIV